MLLRWHGGRTFTGHLFGNREELLLVMQESAQSLSTEERTMINRVLDLQSLTVRQAMKPFSTDVVITRDTRVQEVLGFARDKHLLRLPVWDTREGRRRVVGLINLNQLLFQADVDSNATVGTYLQAAMYVEEDTRSEVALRRMQRGGQRLAVVLGRDRRELGTLDLQDVLEVIFGEVSL